MRWNIIELMRCILKFFLENKYYIIDHVGSLLMAPGLARDMMPIWKTACGPHLFRCVNKIAHCNCHISLCNARKYYFKSWQGDTSDTAIIWDICLWFSLPIYWIMYGYFEEKLNCCDSLVCVKGVDIQSLSHVCASFYILIMVFYLSMILTLAFIRLFSVMRGQLPLW